MVEIAMKYWTKYFQNMQGPDEKKEHFQMRCDALIIVPLHFKTLPFLHCAHADISQKKWRQRYQLLLIKAH